jgi:hypothetical protein
MTTSKGYRRITASRPTVSERQIQDAIKERLYLHGWEVFEISQPRRVSGGIIGVSDLIGVKHGVTIFVESKKPGEDLRPSQVRFAERLRPHLRATLSYTKADDVDEFARWLAATEELAGVVTVREI